MAPTSRPPAELLAEETKVFERLLALCVEHGLPPQVLRFIANGAMVESALPAMRVVAGSNSAGDTLSVTQVRTAQNDARDGKIKLIGDIDSLVSDVLYPIQHNASAHRWLAPHRSRFVAQSCGHVREPRSALCLASRCGRAYLAGAAPPKPARSGQPSLPSPPRPTARPAPVHPAMCTLLSRCELPLLRAACRCATSRRAVARPLRTLLAPRGCRQSSTLQPRRPRPFASCGPQKPSRHSSSVPRAACGVCVHGNNPPTDGRGSADYSLIESWARPAAARA